MRAEAAGPWLRSLASNTYRGYLTHLNAAWGHAALYRSGPDSGSWFQIGLRSRLFGPGLAGERYRCCPVNTHRLIVGPPLNRAKQTNATTKAVATGYHEPACRMITPPAVVKAIAIRGVTKTRSNPGTMIR